MPKRNTSLPVLLMVAFGFSLVGCGSKDATDAKTTAGNASQATPATGDGSAPASKSSANSVRSEASRIRDEDK